MADLTITYFDFPGGRGEDCRLALHIAGADFVDDRVVRGTWPARKPTTPFGNLPVLTVAGKGELAQSNAILGYLGRRFGLHPTDPWEAARHEAILAAAEDLRALLVPSTRMTDPDEKRAAREALATGAIPTWAANVDKQIAGPFVAGDALNVADLKLYVLLRWFFTGGVDHVTVDAFAGSPKLMALYQAVHDHPKVAEWRARF